MLAKESKKADKMAGTYKLEPTPGDPVKPYQQPASWFHARWRGSKDGNKFMGFDLTHIRMLNISEDLFYSFCISVE